ncbi:MAG: hypothetical protein ACRC68_12345 [Clostridium sp.]
MNSKFSIKGIANGEEFRKNNLQNMCVNVLSGSIVYNFDLEDIFEITVDPSIENTKTLVFNDMNLNIFNLSISFNIIGFDKNNKGIVFNYTHIASVTSKSYMHMTSYKLHLLDCTINKISINKLEFSIVAAIDFNVREEMISQLINPAQTNIYTKTQATAKSIFDKEFI